MTTKYINNNLLNEYKYLILEENNLDDLEIFFEINYKGRGSYGSINYFKWKVFNNITKVGIIKCIYHENKIVSVTSITPKTLWINRERLNGAEIGDTYTSEQYQKKGLFSLLVNDARKWSQENGINIIYGTPNTQSINGYKKYADFFKNENIELDTLIIPLNINLLLLPFLGKFISNFAAKLFYLFNKFRIKLIALSKKNKIKNLKSIVSIQELISSPIKFGNEWDNFFEKSRLQYNFILDRSAKSIDWRYFQNPNEYIIYIIKENNVLMGYLVLRILEEKEIKSLVIVDYLTLEKKEEYLVFVLNEIFNNKIDYSFKSISLWCIRNSNFYRVFKDFGFFKITKDSPIIFYNLFNLLILKRLKINWHFTIGDTDNI